LLKRHDGQSFVVRHGLIREQADQNPSVTPRCLNNVDMTVMENIHGHADVNGFLGPGRMGHF
jgi:hypothetical protein